MGAQDPFGAGNERRVRVDQDQHQLGWPRSGGAFRWLRRSCACPAEASSGGCIGLPTEAALLFIFGPDFLATGAFEHADGYAVR